MSRPQIITIPFSDLSSTPDDYTCPDGSLDGSFNLQPDDSSGGLAPAFPPSPVAKLPDGCKLLLQHTVTGRRCNWILYDSRLRRLLFCPQRDTAGLVPVASMDEPVDIAAVGNTLCIALPDSPMIYATWRDDSYKIFNLHTPPVELEFALWRADASLVKIHTGSISGVNVVDGQIMIPSYRVDNRDEAYTTLSNHALGVILDAQSRIREEGKFAMPFFVRYAFRLYDGSYIWHSSTVLMVPSALLPRSVVWEVDAGAGTIRSSAYMPACYLQMRSLILESIPDYYSDIITSVDIFVSAPIDTFLQDSDSISVHGGKRPGVIPETGGSSSEEGGLRPVDDSGSRALDNITTGTDEETVRVYGYEGTYAGPNDGLYTDHFMTLDHYGRQYINPAPNPRFTSQLISCSTFYLVAEIPLSEIAGFAGPFSNIRIKSDVLCALETQPTLTDDWQSRYALSPRALYTFNNRLHLGAVTVTTPRCQPISSMIPFANPTDMQDADSVTSAVVYSRHEGITVASPVAASSVGMSVDSLRLRLPRWIYVPDPQAYELRLTIGDSDYSIPLLQHPSMNGAYYYGGVTDSAKSLPSASVARPASASSYFRASSVYVAAPQNPFIFPPQSIHAVGNGEIIAMRAAVRALSQGQFGQSPLYIFSSDGVWTLITASDGSYLAARPVIREILLAPSAIAQTQGSVFFLSTRGVIHLEGSAGVCISDSLRDMAMASNIAALPGLKSYLAKLGLDASEDALVPFIDFLTGAGIVFDYAGQRLLLFNPRHSYAYVYSLRSRRWGFVASSLAYGVNSWPESLAVDSSGNVVDLAEPDSSSDVPALLITRPMKLGMPDTLKTIRTVLLRGLFRPGYASMILYGSRNLIDWMVVASSADARLHNISGSPYKFFRLVVSCKLSPAHRVVACSFEFLPRMLNRMR